MGEIGSQAENTVTWRKRETSRPATPAQMAAPSGRRPAPGPIRAGRRVQQHAPAYCTDATNLKTSVSNLSNGDVAKNGLSSLQTALSSVQSNASKFATDAKSAFPSQTAALNTSLTALATAIKSAQGQPPATAATAIVPAVAQVKTSASNLQSAVSSAGKC